MPAASPSAPAEAQQRKQQQQWHLGRQRKHRGGWQRRPADPSRDNNNTTKTSTAHQASSRMHLPHDLGPRVWQRRQGMRVCSSVCTPCCADMHGSYRGKKCMCAVQPPTPSACLQHHQQHTVTSAWCLFALQVYDNRCYAECAGVRVTSQNPSACTKAAAGSQTPTAGQQATQQTPSKAP